MYPSNKTYEKLYAAYMKKRPPSELIDLAGDVNGKVVWDLCCGGGAVTVNCLERGAKKVVAVDSSMDMSKDLREQGLSYAMDGKLRVYTDDLRAWIPTHGDMDEPDVVICRQAVNYWMNEKSAADLAMYMPPDSVFVFNTFHGKPMRKPKVREYEHDDKWFIEVSWLVGDTVHHIQVRDGMEPHVTSFQYLSPLDFDRILTPHFAIVVQRDGNTSLYRCVRKKDEDERN